MTNSSDTAKHGKLVALAGGAASGKDTLAEKLEERLRTEYSVQRISGSAVFRSAALFAADHLGFDPAQKLPENAYHSATLELLPKGNVRITREHDSVNYTPDEYLTVRAAKAGSDFARVSPLVYKTFADQAITCQIATNSACGIHSLLPSREAFRLAEQTTVPALCVYLAVTEQAKKERLLVRLRKNNEQNAEALVQQELERDERDLKSGTNTKDDPAWPSLESAPSYRTGAIYRLDTSHLSIPQATETLYRAVRTFLAQHD